MINSSFEPEKQIFEDSGTTIASLNETGPTSADLQRLDEQISSMITKSNISAGTGKGYLATCNVCGKQGPSNSMPRHVEANHISGISHTCDICGTSSRSRNGLRHHKKDYHKDQSFVSGPGMLWACTRRTTMAEICEPYSGLRMIWGNTDQGICLR